MPRPSRTSNPAVALGNVPLMNRLDAFKMLAQGFFHHRRQHGDPVLEALTITDPDLARREVNVLHAASLPPAKDMAVKEQEGTEGLILRRGADLLLDG